METKFKVGDVISSMLDDSYTFTVTNVVVGEKEIKGDWGWTSALLVKDSYVVVDNQYGNLGYLEIEYEKDYHLVSSGSLLKNEVVGFENICPRCTSPLVDKLSVGLGDMIKKCSNCGWC